MECKTAKNSQNCTCSYDGCSRRGLCCECVAYHRSKKELPGCFFPSQAEKTWDRSIDNFISSYKK
ncbi:MAG: hypothetical protein A2039_04785 [Candidatus Melainabacteria bacterium GWA2_34_9]|nr:MAG: hypothetical protein A2039_04785 [Candidatus Melainabacteria bacterium GWA2_34_9]